MQIALQIFIRLCELIVPKKVRLKNEIDRLDEIIKNEPDEKLRRRHSSKRKELSFAYHYQFRARPEHIDSLLDISERSPDIQAFQMRDAYWIWKSENGIIQTEIGRTRTIFGRVLFNVGSAGWVACIIVGIAMNFLADAVIKESCLYVVVGCFILNLILIFLSIPFKQADIIQKHIDKTAGNEITTLNGGIALKKTSNI